MRKAYKSLISLAVVLIAGLNFIAPAFAQDPFSGIAIGGLGGLSGAGLFGSMAGMSGIDISWSGQTSDPMDAMWNVLNPDHVYFSGEKHEASGTGEDVWDYITVDIGDWLDAQSDFIVNFIQANNVTDNSSGTTSAVNEFRGIPINQAYGNYIYSGILGTVEAGGVSGDVKTIDNGMFRITLTYTGTNRAKASYYVDGNLIRTSANINLASSGTYEMRLLLYGGVNPVYLSLKNAAGTADTDRTNIGSLSNVSQNWTSGVVNSHVFDGWESAKVKIPTSAGVLPVNWNIPDFVDAINELWINNQQGQIVIEDTDQPVPPPPVPSTPLGEVPFDDWIDLWGQGIYQQLENQSDTLDLIGSNGEDQIEELESIDSNLDDLNQTAESIDTNIGIGNGILGGIRSLAQSAVDLLEGIAEHVGELVEEIVEGTETLIAGILNQIPQAFGVIFGPIKQASSIWHYVVEWIQSIGAPFQFIWSMASGTSYYIILPVYASLAAAVVLAFYKRFGK